MHGSWILMKSPARDGSSFVFLPVLPAFLFLFFFFFYSRAYMCACWCFSFWSMLFTCCSIFAVRHASLLPFAIVPRAYNSRLNSWTRICILILVINGIRSIEILIISTSHVHITVSNTCNVNKITHALHREIITNIKELASWNAKSSLIGRWCLGSGW